MSLNLSETLYLVSRRANWLYWYNDILHWSGPLRCGHGTIDLPVHVYLRCRLHSPQCRLQRTTCFTYPALAVTAKVWHLPCQAQAYIVYFWLPQRRHKLDGGLYKVIFGGIEGYTGVMEKKMRTSIPYDIPVYPSNGPCIRIDSFAEHCARSSPRPETAAAAGQTLSHASFGPAPKVCLPRYIGSCGGFYGGY